MSEAETTPPRLPKPESLEAKYKLLETFPYDARVKRRHSIVYGFIVDWYHSKYGNALASVRHIVSTLNARIKERNPDGKELFAGEVHSALVDLVAWGYLHQEKGRGRRASRYIPVWGLVCSVQKSPNATDDAPSVLETPNADVRESPNATVDSVRDSLNEDPSTVTRPQDRVNGIDGHDTAAPTAPLSAGLSAADAGTAVGFEELRRVYYPKKGKDIKRARAAYDKLAPDAGLHSDMVESAATWHSSWAAQDNPNAPRHSLERWILDERYLENPPAAYRPKEPKTRLKKARPTKAEPVADNDNDDDDLEDEPIVWVGDVGPFSPSGSFITEIAGSTVTQPDQYTEQVVLHLSIRSRRSQPAVEIDHTFFAQSYDVEKQERGQMFLKRLQEVLGLASAIQDTDVLHGRELRCNISKVCEIKYEKLYVPEPYVIPAEDAA